MYQMTICQWCSKILSLQRSLLAWNLQLLLHFALFVARKSFDRFDPHDKVLHCKMFLTSKKQKSKTRIQLPASDFIVDVNEN